MIHPFHDYVGVLIFVLTMLDCLNYVPLLHLAFLYSQLLLLSRN